MYCREYEEAFEDALSLPICQNPASLQSFNSAGPICALLSRQGCVSDFRLEDYSVKRLDLIANLAVIITSVALLVFLGNSWYERYHAPHPPEAKVLVGSTVKLPSIVFGQKSKTLLLVISPTCRFCRDSEPFYRQLAQTASLKTHLVAVLPQAQSEAESYVHFSIAPSLQVVSASLDTMGVSGTPAILLVDSQGKVEKVWVGKLDDAGQKQVQSQL